MKLNYLSIALATALATTLTACGSDNSSNYNQPTVSPAPQAKPDAGAKPGNDAGTSKPGNDAGTSKPGNDAGTNKPAEDNKKPEGDANKKPEGDANKKPDGDADADKKPEKQQPEKQEEGKKPEAEAKPNKEINPGNAANPGNVATDNFVVAQNYIRGAGSSFDKDNNKDKTGNASVLGFNELNNQYMSNIILGRVSKDGKLTNFYAGEQPDQVKNNTYRYVADAKVPNDNGTIGNLQQDALQLLNDTDFSPNTLVGSVGKTTGNSASSNDKFTTANNEVKNATKAYGEAAIKVAALKAAEAAAAETGATNDSILKAARRIAAKAALSYSQIDSNDAAYKIAEKAVKAVKGKDNNAVAAADYQKAATTAQAEADKLKTSMEAAFTNLTNKLKAQAQAQAQAPQDSQAHSKLVTDYGPQYYAAGLVRAFQAADNKPKSKAQKDDNQNPTFFVRGQENPVFTIDKDGKFVVTNVTGSSADVKDAPKTSDDVRMFGSLSKEFDVPARRWNPNDKEFETNPGYDSKAQTQNAWEFDVEARNNTIKQSVKNKQQVTLEQAIVPNTLHLNHVQYGRVTANTDTDAIGALTQAYKDGTQFHQFLTTAKHNEQDKQSKADFDKADTTIDYYFARGLEPTVKMPTEGKINYRGHALTYGLDNSFHGGKDKNDTNTAVLTPRHAIGNFVEATLDTATKNVTGSIYNVWTNDANNPNEGVVKDNLVTFDGKVQGNTSSVVGDAKLAYTPKVADTPTDASFRGGFFGANASELAGNINTTKEGYADTAWGAVFGAKAIATPESGLPIENQVEAKK